jgi:S1-C subfamily serine protease
MNHSWGSGTDVDANRGAQDTLSVDHGANVASVVQYGASLAAGILFSDLIVQIDNTPVTDPQSPGLAKRWRNIEWGNSRCASGWSGIAAP